MNILNIKTVKHETKQTNKRITSPYMKTKRYRNIKANHIKTQQYITKHKHNITETYQNIHITKQYLLHILY